MFGVKWMTSPPFTIISIVSPSRILILSLMVWLTPNDGAEPPPPVTQREQAKWTTSNPTLWPKPKAGGGWLQQSECTLLSSSTQNTSSISIATPSLHDALPI